MDENPYDRLYESIAQSTTYREVLRAAVPSLPGWIVPLSVTSLHDLEVFSDLMELRPGQRFVDLACGLGGVALWISERSGATCSAVDFSTVAIQHAAELAKSRGLNGRATFVAADMCESGLESKAFDSVLSVDAVQFVDADKIAAEIARILRPGGIAVVRSWEALSEDVPRPTMVTDYRPVFERAGFQLVSKAIIEDRLEWLNYFTEIDRRASAFREELGDAVEPILEEAAEMLRRADQPPRTQRMLLKVRRQLN